MMQSSRRKRERVENDGQAVAAGPGASSSRGRARGQQKRRLVISHGDTGEKNEAVSSAASTEMNRPAAQSQSPTTDASRGAASTVGEMNGGNDHSKVTPEMNTTNQEETGSASADGNVAPANTRKGGSSLGDGDGEDESKERIGELISHRKLLLARMRQCRVAAESRIKQNHDKQQQAAPKAESKDGKKVTQKDETKVIAAKSEPAQGTVSSDDEEVERYRESCRLAVQASRKQKAEGGDGSAEKRVSVSLRRGSSVGKRMNAAISTLTSSGAASSSLSADAPAQQLPATAISTESLPPVSSVAVKSSQMPPPNSKHAALSAAMQRTQSVAAPASTKSTASAPGSQKYGAGQGQKKRSSSSQKNLKVYSGTGSASSTIRPGSTSLPLHVGAETNRLPFNRLASPTVHFPEAQSLREQRDSIRDKLSTLIGERIARMEQAEDEQKKVGRRQQSTLSSRSGRPMDELKFVTPATDLDRGAYSPSKLPRRRKTHWDYVLEEMRWLATDFVEERKWKAASARTLGAAVVANRLTAVKPVSAAELDKKAANDDGNTGEEDHSEDVDEKAIAESGDSDAEEQHSRDRAGERSYEHPTPTDQKCIQRKARIISDIIGELWEGTHDCGALSNADGPLLAALARHNKLRQTLERHGENADSSPLEREQQKKAKGSGSGSDEEIVESSTVESKNDKSAHESKETDDGMGTHPVLSNDDISERIEPLTARAKNRIVRRNRAKAQREPVALGKEQRKAVDFVEFLWSGDSAVGSIIDGPCASGKTVLSCSLIWRRRSEGAQLLACSPARVVRWIRELERFTGLRVHLFGLQCGVSSSIPEANTLSDFREGDVVICEFSTLAKASLNMSEFSTIIFDARFPVESLSERKPTGDLNLLKKVEGQNTAKNLIPREFKTHQWWATFLGSVQQSSARRLVIDNRETSFLREKDGLDCTGLTDRERLDTLAAMTAFVVGPDLFNCSSSRSPQHKVVSWAKHCAKEGNQRKRPQLEEVRGVLADASLPFRYSLPSEVESQGSHDGHTWDVRCCSLSASQRSDYEQCCMGVRGALSFGSVAGQNGSRSYEEAMKALLRLRRACVHSRLDEVLFKSMMPGPSDSRHSPSVSQPNADVVQDIISGSAKLKKLVEILREECGFNIQMDIVPGKTRKGRKKKAPARKIEKKRVAILAVLPEAQLLTSVLLNALGIPHELLASPGSHSGHNSIEREIDQSIGWLSSQLSLLKFDSTLRSPVATGEDNSASNRFPLCEVIIASPLTVGADNGGLCVEAADVIISIDEDWSGRDALLFERIWKRCSFAHEISAASTDKSSDQHCDFIRLACGNTCEQVFLSGFHNDNENGAEVDSGYRDWPQNGEGYLDLPSVMSSLDIALVDEDHVPDDDDLEGSFRFPAQNVIRYRGTLLSTVLATSEDMPTELTGGDVARFLPFQVWDQRNAKSEKSLSIELVRSLVSLENMSRQAPLMLRYADRPQASFSSYYCATPPLPSDYPSAVSTRHDLMALGSRIYVARFGNRLASVDGSVAPALASVSKLTGPTGNRVLSEDTDAAVTADHGNLADAWHKSGLSCKPGDLVPSLLLYNPPRVQTRDFKNDLEDEHESAEVSKTKHPQVEDQSSVPEDQLTKQHPGAKRANAFSATFCSSHEVVSNIVKDGNSGCEPLAYFPPLFPSLLGTSQQVVADLAHQQKLPGDQQTLLHENGAIPGVPSALYATSRKRSEPPTLTMAEDPKRPRLDNASSAIEVPWPPQHVQHHPRPALGSDSAARGAAILDTAPAGRMGTEASVVTEDEASQWDPASLLCDLGEDYGLLGIGALAPQSDSARDAAMLSVGAASYTTWNDPYEAEGLEQELFKSSISCDAEEVAATACGEADDSYLDTMLLFVTKRPRVPTASGYAGLSGVSTAQGGLNLAWSRSRATSGLPSSAVSAAYTGGAVSEGRGTNGAGNSKKIKKKSQSTTSTGAFARVNSADFAGRTVNPYIGQSAFHSAKGKETYRSKVLSSILARQGGGRSTLFQVPSFLLASIRIRDDVLRRVLGASEGVGPGYHSTYRMRRPWVRACRRLISSSMKTGDEARRVSEQQRSRMEHMPSPVDFGPFSAGYIASPYAMYGSLPTAAKTGISLPMGVKISHRSRSHPGEPWDEAQDERLKKSVLRYSSNWHLVARAVNLSNENETPADHGEGAAPAPINGVLRTTQRSPRQCQERWRYLTKSKPGLSEELRLVERNRWNNTVGRPKADDVGRNRARLLSLPKSLDKPKTVGSGTDDKTLSLLLPIRSPKEQSDQDANQEKPTSQRTKGKRSFKAFRSSSKKKYETPLPILGSSGGEKPSLAATHPSHSQSVQAAVTAVAGGRTEMWPLQILDLTDKQRAAVRHAASSSAAAQAQRSPARPSKRASHNYPQVPGSNASHASRSTSKQSPKRVYHTTASPGVSSNGGMPK